MLPEVVAITGAVVEAVLFWRIYACVFGGLFASAAAWWVVPGIRAQPVFTVGAVVGLAVGVYWQHVSSRAQKHGSAATGGTKLSRGTK
jgi:hypothetical protein